MRTFGWKAGVDYCPHLSDATTAWFAGVLGMPWMDDGTGGVPRLAQALCQQGFSDWLAPWHKAPVEWVLLARDSSDAAAKWAPVGSAAYATQGLALNAAERANLVDQCVARLHAYVRGHMDAMGEEPMGDESPIFTYPIVSPGIAHLPAYLSDSAFGTSALLKVDRAALPPNAEVVAVPKFTLSDGAANPLMDVHPGNLIRYQGPLRTVDNQVYSFHGVMVRALGADEVKHDSARAEATHRFLSVRSRTPDRQLYATLSRQFSPLRMWLWSVNEVAAAAVTGYSGKEFCSLLVRLLGAGEDELVGADSVSSIYEMVLPREAYQVLFGVAHADRPDGAKRMLDAFEAWMANDTGGQRAKDLLEQFAVNLGMVGLEANRKCIAEKILAAATDALPVDADVISSARELYSSLEQQHAAARAGWAAWLATVLPLVIPASGAGHIASAVELILEGAKTGIRDSTGQAGSVLDDDVLRLLNGQIDHSPDFWTEVHDKADDIAAALTAARVSYLGPIVQRVAAGQPLVAAKLGEAYDRASKAVTLAAHEADPQADDPPLQLGFRPAGGTTEEAVRGCLLALRIGVPRGAGTDWKDRGWITSAWAQPSLGAGMYGTEMMAADGRKAVFCDTQGSTQSDGLDEQVAVYGGVPLLAAAEEDSPNPSMPELFRSVPTDQPVPALAYGARYGGFSVTVDNAGNIIEPALRGAKPGEPLEPIPKILFESDGTSNAPAPFQYLSRRPPGAPVFIGYKDWDVKQDTLTLSAAGVEPGSHHVAVLYSGFGFKDAQPRQEVQLRAPSVGPGFVERWLAADALADIGDPFRWEPVRSLTRAELEALQTDIARAGQLVFTHPAVEAVEISATWFAGNLRNAVYGPDKLDWNLKHFRAGHWLQAETLKLRIEQAAGTDPNLRKFTLDASGPFIDIVVPRGMQVRLEARCLLPKDLLDGVNARLHKSALVMSEPTVERPYVPHGAQAYGSRVPQVMWIESLPEVPADADLFNLKPGDFRLSMPASAAKPQEIALEFAPTSPRSAHWIARVELEQKRWQWSGYPVRFPASGALDRWLPLYAGTKDYMPALPDAGFTTKWDAAGNWLLDAIVMKPVPLPSVRPANHMGLVVKVVPRFAKLLADATLARIGLTHIFDHVRGLTRPGGERIAAPVWNEAIPMPQTVAVDANTGNFSQTSRGNLLVLADPLYDTSDTGAFGGIAERVEFDVVATWYTSPPPAPRRILEAGPNPIFHGAPPPTEPQPGFEVDTIFGLTYDKAPGGRAAQTGIVLRPSNTKGRWTLAKCRLRRFVLPHLMLDTELPGLASGGVWVGSLGLRQAEQSWVPLDFVLYSAQEIVGANLPGYAIQFPAAAGNFARAYMVTWHRDRWAQAEPKWRPLVRLYERRASFAEWSIKEQMTPFDTGVADFEPMGKGVGSLELSYQGTATAYRIDVSDFTESRWLTFIGSFGQEVPPGREQIEVARAGNGYAVRATAGSRMPVLGPRDHVRPSLLLIFAPQLDLMRGRIETEGGELVGVYAANRVQGGTVTFDEAILPCTCDIGQRQALLIQVQRHNVESPEHVIAAGKWADLVDGLFPQEADQKEATMRFLPEYIGPMKILPE